MNSEACSPNRSAREYPIDRSSPVEQRVRGGRSQRLLGGCAKKPRPRYGVLGNASGNVEIKVAGKDYRRIQFVAASIVQALSELGAAQSIVAAALEM